MVTKIRPGAATAERMPIYALLARFGFVRDSYARKFALAAFLGILVPLAIFIVYLIITRHDLETLYPVIAALFLASFAGWLGTLWLLRELLVPIDVTAETLR